MSWARSMAGCLRWSASLNCPRLPASHAIRTHFCSAVNLFVEQQWHSKAHLAVQVSSIVEDQAQLSRPLPETQEGLILSEAQLEHIKGQVLAALQRESSHQAPSVKEKLAVGGKTEENGQEKVPFVLLAQFTPPCRSCPSIRGTGVPALDREDNSSSDDNVVDTGTTCRMRNLGPLRKNISDGSSYLVLQVTPAAQDVSGSTKETDGASAVELVAAAVAPEAAAGVAGSTDELPVPDAVSLVGPLAVFTTQLHATVTSDQSHHTQCGGSLFGDRRSVGGMRLTSAAVERTGQEARHAGGVTRSTHRRPTDITAAI